MNNLLMKAPVDRKRKQILILNENLGIASKKYGVSVCKIRDQLGIPNRATLTTTKHISGFNSRVVDFMIKYPAVLYKTNAKSPSLMKKITERWNKIFGNTDYEQERTNRKLHKASAK